MLQYDAYLADETCVCSAAVPLISLLHFAQAQSKKKDFMFVFTPCQQVPKTTKDNRDSSGSVMLVCFQSAQSGLVRLCVTVHLHPLRFEVRHQAVCSELFTLKL